MRWLHGRRVGTVISAAEGDETVTQIIELVVNLLEDAEIDVDPVWDLLHAAIRPHADAAVRAAITVVKKSMAKEMTDGHR